MPAPVKRKVSVTIDAELVAEIEAEGGNVSARVNEALRLERARRGRNRALASLLERLAAGRGALNTVEDRDEIDRFVRLLGGPDEPIGGAVDEPSSRPRAS